ncbi:TonB family protein [Carboxylicivirga sp. M1479]|uniref:TonB family protein n=1 Tax=Carboxylicivirga sp. M1479 TaxID=2594476 RepID=UPI0011789712|nr:TonB family protein [Carboxylicivirga sp. M1479]TRX65925.1 TonB family protein [Carboxylicivirga sp. M1479]
MKKVSYVVMLLMLTVGIMAQEEEMKQKFIEETRVEAPVFIGETNLNDADRQNFSSHLQEELTYLSELDYLGKEGIVAIDFVIETDGSVTNVMVSNSVSKTIDEAVLKAVTNSSNMWKAGKINGQENAMDKTIYVKFDIPGNASHNEQARENLNLAIKQVSDIDKLENKDIDAAAKTKKTARKAKSAQTYLEYAEQYKPNDLSITYWQARVYELQGNNDQKEQKLDQYLELARHHDLEKSLEQDILMAVISFK